MCCRAPHLEKEMPLRTLAVQNAQRKRKISDLKEIIEQVSPQHMHIVGIICLLEVGPSLFILGFFFSFFFRELRSSSRLKRAKS